MKHQWQVRRQFVLHPDGEQRWDRVYQLAQSFLPKHPLPSSISFTKRLWNEGNPEDRQRIMKLVLERVWLSGENMVALWVRPQYLIWMREGLKDRAGEPVEPARLPPFLLKEQKENGNFRLLESYRCGSDGRRMFAGKTPVIVLAIPKPPTQRRVIAPTSTVQNMAQLWLDRKSGFNT